MTIKKIILLVVLALVLVVASVSTVYLLNKKTTVLNQTGNGSVSSKKEVNALTVYDWWTSPSESAAFNKLVEVYTKEYPDVAIMASPVLGGAGFKMLPVIKKLAEAGEAPDAFQMHAGYEARPYYDAGLLSSIDYIWQSEGLEKVIPQVVQDMNKFDGHYYSIPVDVHRSNVVWYNKNLLDKNGIKPATLITWEAFFTAADKLKSRGIKYPIQIGESWTLAHAFEQIVASEGISFYEDWVNGKVVDANDPRLLKALKTFKQYLSYINSDYKTTTWDVAVKRVIKGESAFSIMGDWANGEFKLAGMKYGVDYGTILVPGTQGMYGLVMDTFQHPNWISHPTNSDRWLRVVASSKGQDSFNPVKGSISPRSDSDISKYDLYQQAAIKDFKTAKFLFPSVTHGSGAPESFKLKLNGIMENFAVDFDVVKAATALTKATSENLSDYNKVWTLK